MSEAAEQPGTPGRRRDVEAAPPTAAKSAAAAMDDLDAEEMAAARADTRDRAAEFERYRDRASVTSQDLADHVRGGRRIEDGKLHQIWDWTNADVCTTVRDVLRRRFGDHVVGRELNDVEGFDRDGNRIRQDGGIDGVVGAAGDRFNDVVRELDGTKVFGTERGLDVAEVQILRSRYQHLVVTEQRGEAQREANRRSAVGWSLFALALLVFALLLVALANI